jgi:hypothetical protein
MDMFIYLFAAGGVYLYVGATPDLSSPWDSGMKRTKRSEVKPDFEI